MEMIPSTPLRKKWRKMSWGAEEALVRQLAVYQARLFEKPFQKIGSLFLQDYTLVVSQRQPEPLPQAF
jgi:hypothetical protein